MTSATPTKLFVGREDEAAVLKGLLQTPQADLVTIIGRRRIGKTYLVKQAFDQKFHFYFTGIRDADKTTLLKAFTAKIAEYAKPSFTIATPQDWMEAFSLLKSYLQTVKTIKKKVIFLDEFPWMDNHKSGFLQAFEYFWNDYAVNEHIIIVLCGSSTSWMIKNVLNNKGGLHNRITKYINLAPFTLQETKALFVARGIKLPHYEIVQIYMALGGVPYYLNEVQNGETAIQNIDRILFSAKSTLKNEFHNLYRALFDNYENYESIIKALSTKRKGLTRQEIIAATKITNGGSLTKMLIELEESSFIKSFQPYEKTKKETLFRLMDEYSMFYYTFSLHKITHSFKELSATPKYKAWCGFAFESCCIRHINKIKIALGIAGIFSQESSYYSKGTEKNEGFQIDLLIDRKDNAINICEMKFYAQDYALNAKEGALLRQRRELFRNKTHNKKYLINTLITTYGIKHNEHSIGVVDKVVLLKELF